MTMIPRYTLLAVLLLLAQSCDGFTTGSIFKLSSTPALSARSMCAKQSPMLGLRMSDTAEMTFTAEMRAKAMSLHTFSQAPKEGKEKDKSANTVVDQWETTKEDFLQFLVDSKVVYEALEKAVEKSSLSRFQNTGLERVEPLAADIAWFKAQYGMDAPAASKEAHDYADYLLGLDDPVFICHFYNYYFAHTAGGRMIGKTVMDTQFGGHLFNFYKWDRDVKEVLTEVKAKIDEQAQGWTREQKDSALDATPMTFQKSGQLLRTLVGKARDRAARMSSKVQVKAGKLVGVPEMTYTKNKAVWDV